ncbi:MAG: tetratricopeptide repeat protein [Spirochaetaceae bacterium]|nr:tetratricopeptide repeat protein [Spirochaetaceae bacterium]
MKKNKFFRLALFLIFALFCTQNIFSQTAKTALNKFYAARSLESQGKVAEAKQSYSEIVRICKDEISRNVTPSENYVVLGWTLIRLERYNDAIRICQEGLKIAPTEYRHNETMGEAYFYLNRYNESIKMFETYLGALPNGVHSATALFFLGEIYRLTSKFEHSDIAYSAALRKEPSIPLWWYRLGRTREAAGKNKEALEAYQKALKLRPSFSDAQEAINRLS